MRFTGTTIIITGAADGLGSVMATAFAAADGRDDLLIDRWRDRARVPSG